ncbi:MAG: hypothetical protein L3I99_01890 [Sulfurimonas sp.]|nr:hypothetical protein [Sulfurimonas sp.]
MQNTNNQIMRPDIDLIQSVYNWNLKAGLLNTPYSDANESKFPIEEALEGFRTDKIAGQLNIDIDSNPKEISRQIIGLIDGSEDLSDTDRFDKHLDIIVYSFGSLFKLGLSPEQAINGLVAVMDANSKKLESKIDSHGKLGKPADFVGPEKELEKILKERER